MRVEKFDAQGAPLDLLHDLHACDVAATAELTPGEPPMLFEQYAGYRRHPADGVRHYWLAREGAEIAGTAGLYVFGPAFAFVEVNVRPSSRRQGVGTALLDALVATARTDRVESAFGHHATPAGAAFAAKAGARDDQRDVRSRLDLRAADLPEPRVPAGVELVSWIGRTPTELLETHVEARHAMDDAPTPGGTEHPGWSLEQQLLVEEASVARGRPPRVTAAIEAGEIVAFTDLRVGAPPAPVAQTDDTATLPRVRGRGLATAVKRESLRRLRAERPHVELVVTLNAEHNAAMRAVNTKLGFEPVTIFTTSVLDLNPG
jgi:GNAT superfamily N-acetyltransferase